MSSTTRSTGSSSITSTRSPTVSVHVSGSAPKNVLTFVARDLGEVVSPFVGVHGPVAADSAEQRTGERPRADAGLEDPGAREDVGHADDLGGVLGVDDRGTARHRQHEVGQQRSQGQVGHTPRRRDDDALRLSEQVVVRDRALVGVEELARLERDRVQLALGVAQLDPVPGNEGAANSSGRSRRRHSGAPYAERLIKADRPVTPVRLRGRWSAPPRRRR